MSAFQAEDDSSNLFIRSEYKLILVMLLFCYICLGFLFLLIRNNFVASFWMRIDKIYACDNYISLCKEFDKVSYASMVLKFYKPLKTKYWYSKKFCDIIK